MNMFHETETSISAVGITATDMVSKTEYQWRAFVRLLETDKFYYLYTSSIMALILPKEKISEAELSELDQLFISNMPPEIRFKLNR
jgi:hypothetical protein